MTAKIDPFLWLEDLGSKDSLAWVDRQNKKTAAQWFSKTQFHSLKDAAKQIFNNPSRLTVGQISKNYLYHLWQDEKNPQGLLRRIHLDDLLESKKWEILFDVDEHSKAKGQNIFLNYFDLQKQGQRILFYLSVDGKDETTIAEFDVETKSFVVDGFHTKSSKDSLRWINQDAVFWSSTKNPTHCGYASEIYLIERNQSPKLIAKASKNSMSIHGFCLEDSEGNFANYIFHQLSWNETEISYLNQGELIPTQLPLSTRIMGLYHGRLVLWLETAWGSFPADSVLLCKRKKHYHSFDVNDFEIIFNPSSDGHYQDLTIYRDGIAVSVTQNLQFKILLSSLDGDGQSHKVFIEIPEGNTLSHIFTNNENTDLFVSFQSFIHPPSLYVFKNKDWQLIQKTAAHFEHKDVIAKQEWAKSKDGTLVPYWVVYTKKNSFPRPTLQYGYGGFLSSNFPNYLPLVGKLWLERGGVFVLSQIRGGCELGVSWHQAATLENKQKSYDDFIAISEDLIKKGYTTAKQLAIQGRSNGGLLVGATLTQRPDLYGAAVIEVPLLDMMRYVELPPGSSWIGEYGDPRTEAFHDVILKYSPYQNIEKHNNYPPTLIRTSRSDDRVHPGHARKMAAKMQSLNHEVWFYEEELGGHHLTPVHVKSEQVALVYCFLSEKLGL